MRKESGLGIQHGKDGSMFTHTRKANLNIEKNKAPSRKSKETRFRTSPPHGGAWWHPFLESSAILPILSSA